MEVVERTVSGVDGARCVRRFPFAHVDSERRVIGVR
jgi:hypothetical protein